MTRPTRRLGLVLAGGVVGGTLSHVGVGGTTALVIGGRAAAGVVGDTAGHVGVRGGTARVVLSLAVGGSQSTGGQSQGKEDVVDADHYGRMLVLE